MIKTMDLKQYQLQDVVSQMKKRGFAETNILTEYTGFKEVVKLKIDRANFNDIKVYIRNFEGKVYWFFWYELKGEKYCLDSLDNETNYPVPIGIYHLAHLIENELNEEQESISEIDSSWETLTE